MQLQIVTGTGVSIYRQVVDQITRLIELGELPAGEELPAIRMLAERVRVNPNTIARAYMELERAGRVTKRQGAGTYVAERSGRLSQAVLRKRIEGRVRELLVEAGEIGLVADDLIELIRKQGRKTGRR